MRLNFDMAVFIHTVWIPSDAAGSDMWRLSFFFGQGNGGLTRFLCTPRETVSRAADNGSWYP